MYLAVGFVEMCFLYKCATGMENWERKTILVVEDDEISLEFLKELFEPYKVKIIDVLNGIEAIELCKSNPDIDLVLMDVQLPVLNGRDAMKEIKKLRPALPVIYFAE